MAVCAVASWLVKVMRVPELTVRVTGAYAYLAIETVTCLPDAGAGAAAAPPEAEDVVPLGAAVLLCEEELLDPHPASRAPVASRIRAKRAEGVIGLMPKYAGAASLG